MSKYLTDADMAEIDRLHVKADLVIDELLRSIDTVREFIDEQPRVLPYVQSYHSEIYTAGLKLSALSLRLTEQAMLECVK